MKKFMIALAVAALAYTGADAQEKNKVANCGQDQGQVCRKNGNQTSCYKTNFAQNYQVSKGANGYYIACQGATAAGTAAAYNLPMNEEGNTEADDAEMTETETAPAANCVRNEGQVCRKGPNGQTSCYKTGSAQNYKVCRDANGYHTCCQHEQK